MLLVKRPTLMIAVFLLILHFHGEVGVSETLSTEKIYADSSLYKELNSLKLEIRSEVSKFDSLKRDFSDLKIKMANKYLDWGAYVFAAVIIFTALISTLSAIFSYRKYKDVREESREYLHDFTILKKETQSYSEEIKASKREFDEETTEVIEESRKLRDDLRKYVRRSRDSIDSWLRVFKTNVERNTEMLTEIMKQFGEITGVKISEEKLMKIHDKIYQKQIYLYDLSSFIADLNSEIKEERIRAIWGIEGMGVKENIKDLQKVVDNRDEDADIRIEAQKSIENMKNRFDLT